VRIGLGLIGQSESMPAMLNEYRRAEDLGFEAIWSSNIFTHDAVTMSALAGTVTERVELGTFVVPTYPRHPAAFAQQVLTAQSATSNRLVLGIGLSHRVVIENMMGLDYSKPVRHMREYLSVLVPLLRGEAVQFEGEEYRVNLQITVPGTEKPPVIVAALGPQMLKLAGRMADGTAVWMGGPGYLENTCIPTITAAAHDAGRPDPRVVVGFPIALTNEEEAARTAASKQFEVYGTLPSYRAILDKERADNPADIAMIGDEATIRAGLARLRDIGVTDFNASPFRVPGDSDAVKRTIEFMAGVAKSGL
jgi:F420-dependent oxidoreductase-like protein